MRSPAASRTRKPRARLRRPRMARSYAYRYTGPPKTRSRAVTRTPRGPTVQLQGLFDRDSLTTNHRIRSNPKKRLVEFAHKYFLPTGGEDLAGECIHGGA